MPSATQNKAPFLKFVAYLQIIGIIFVVFGHSFHEYPDGSGGKSLFIYRSLYNVRMPLFTFVSGYLMFFTYRLKESVKTLTPLQFTLNKIKRLVVPFIFLSCITFIPRCMMSGMADDDIEFSIKSFAESMVYGGKLVIPFYWFLQMSFILLVFNYAIIYFCRRNAIKSKYYLTATALLFIIFLFVDIPVSDFLSLNYVFKFGLFFVLGITYGHYTSQIDNLFRLNNVLAILGYGLIWIISFLFTENTDLQFLSSIVGILSFISLAKALENNNIKVLDHLIGTNYIIFLLSWFGNVTAQQVLHHFTDLSWYVYSTLSLFIGIYMPWLIFKLLERNKDSKWSKAICFLLGQQINKKYKR